VKAQAALKKVIVASVRIAVKAGSCWTPLGFCRTRDSQVPEPRNLPAVIALAWSTLCVTLPAFPWRKSVTRRALGFGNHQEWRRTLSDICIHKSIAQRSYASPSHLRKRNG